MFGGQDILLELNLKTYDKQKVPQIAGLFVLLWRAQIYPVRTKSQTKILKNFKKPKFRDF